LELHTPWANLWSGGCWDHLENTLMNFDQQRHQDMILYTEWSLLGKECVQSDNEWASGYEHLTILGYWRLIWKSIVPPWVRNSMWRMCRGCIPTRATLNFRGVQCPIVCPLCEVEVETIIHVFFTCTKNKDCWLKLDISHCLEVVLLQTESSKKFFFTLFSKLQEERKDKMLFYYGAYGGGGGGMTRSRKKGFPKFMVKRGEEFHQSWKCAKIKDQLRRIDT